MPADGYDYVLVNDDGREVFTGEMITDRLGFSVYLRGYNDRHVYISSDKDCPLLDCQALDPHVYNLSIVPVRLDVMSV